MLADSAISDSLARLRASVEQARERAGRDREHGNEPSPLAEPIVAVDNTPAERRRSRQLETLRREHLALSKKVSELEDKALNDNSEWLKHLSGFESQQAQAQKALEATQLIQAAAGIVNTLQSTAYGQPGSLLSANNLLLAGNQLLWTYADPIARSLGISIGPSPSALSYWAPLLSLVTARVVVGERQQARFISGVTTFDGVDPVRFEGLRTRVASGLWHDFQQRRDIAVTAQMLTPIRDIFVAAEVREGMLRIAANSRDGRIPKGLRVAWIVDTGDANG
jgi:hypothetical protein